jgi:hypothetical protein
MRLCDIDEILDRFPAYDDKEERKKSLEQWTAFFSENVDPLTKKRVEFTQRSFGDGGYLDNKPFTYATENTYPSGRTRSSGSQTDIHRAFA